MSSVYIATSELGVSVSYLPVQGCYASEFCPQVYLRPAFPTSRSKEKRRNDIKQWYSPVVRPECGGYLSWDELQQSQKKKKRTKTCFAHAGGTPPRTVSASLGQQSHCQRAANHNQREEIACLWLFAEVSKNPDFKLMNHDIQTKWGLTVLKITWK